VRRPLIRMALQSKRLARRIGARGGSSAYEHVRGHEEVHMLKPERQTARVALLIKPSMKRRVERRARSQGVTANECIRRAIEEALAAATFHGAPCA
jgi:hypothetical protein